jgi:uncharacterized protein (TIGR03435 family)
MTGLQNFHQEFALVLIWVAVSLSPMVELGQARAQSLPQKSISHHDIPQFDAASINPTPPSDDKTLVQITPDGASFHGAPVRLILEMAFGIDDKHLLGAPSWTGTKRYDIQAKVSPEDAPRLDKLKGGERNAMLVPLLVERFGLKYHHETREFQIYALKVAKGGPRLTKGEPDPAGGFKFPDPDHPLKPSEEHFKVMTTMGHIEADSISMYILADQLTRLNALGRAVVDKTNITGNYNFTLRWAADPFPLLHDTDGLGSATEKDENTPSSLFTAIQEQLGLKLEPQKDRVDVIVIDHIDPPSPN